MEFKALKNIESSFRQIRLFSMVFLGCCALVTIFAVWRAFSFAEAQRQKIYVLDEGKSLMLALSQDLAQNRPVEAREHVRRFHELFFTLSPDKAAIEGNVERALVLADRSALSYYRDLMEKGYFDTYPYRVRTFGRQKLMRESTVTERSLVTTCRLVNATRSDANPQGFMIEQFTIVENKDLGTYDR